MFPQKALLFPQTQDTQKILERLLKKLRQTLQVKILDFGLFDVTKIEQKLLEFVPSDTNQNEKINMKKAETENLDFLSLEEKKKAFVLAPQISTPDGFVNTNGKPITPFSIKTIHFSPGDAANIDALKQLSYQRFGRAREARSS